MQLREGIKLYITRRGANPPDDPLEISSGTQTADSGYAESSFLPRSPWQKPTVNDTAVLLTSELLGAEYGKWLAIFDVPQEVMKAFEVFREAIASGASEKDLADLLQTPPGREAKNRAIQYACSLLDPQNPDIEAPIVHFGPPGALTATKDRDARFIGLHVDSWYRFDLAERVYAPNRLSINLGDQCRYLLYVNLPLQAIGELMKESVSENELRYGVGIGLRSAFMRAYPDYPIVKLHIKPGQAYIAPTENMIHDGSTTGQAHLDMQFNIRGYFLPPSGE